MATKLNWTRVNSDSNGNPHYVVAYHQAYPFATSYAHACKLGNKIGGRKFHNKTFGGGIVFQSYSLEETERDLFQQWDEQGYISETKTPQRDGALTIDTEELQTQCDRIIEQWPQDEQMGAVYDLLCDIKHHVAKRGTVEIQRA